MNSLQDPESSWQDGSTATRMPPDIPPAMPPDSPLELRVLTGLQAGAALPLNQALKVGRADDCDLLLLDDQAPPHLCDIEPTQDGRLWMTPHQEGLMTESGQPLFDRTEVAPGVAFGVDGLWLEVRTSDAEWAPWIPPSERAAGMDAFSSEADEALDDEGEPGGAESPTPTPPRIRQDAVDTDEVNFDDWMGAALDPSERSSWAIHPSDRPQPTAAEAPRRVGSRRWQTWLVVATGGVMTLCGVVAIGWQLGLSKGSDLEPAAAMNTRADPTELAPAPRVSATSSLSPLSGVGTSPDPASLPEAQVPARTTALAARGVQPGATPGVTVVRGATDVTLPFEVREVIFGARSRVVLSSGQVLVPGDAVGAWRLMEIRRGSLVFDGPQRVLLPW